MSKREFGPTGWRADRLPDLTGKTYVITGANSGIGFEAARMLGANGARVLMLCRNKGKADAAASALASAAPNGAYEIVQMDLADLSSVRAAADTVRAKCERIDGLINNAGLMMLPKRELTADGFEMQFGVNHLGHFVLNARLSDLVEAAAGRFVAVASIAHKYARGFKLKDVNLDSGYTATAAYCRSKLANLSYALELNRRLEASGAKAHAYGCHPGWSATNLQTTGPGAAMGFGLTIANAVFAQSAVNGALPTVLCAAEEDAVPGGYYGPSGFREFRGPVDRVQPTRAARDEAMAKDLWSASQSLTGESWPLLERKAA
ncbi:MAG: oxidoreductase [Pseudomonadota bacterium]